ncbi:phosphoglucosamine mutase [Oligella urethralis]|uniref:Phosphoglucosamine mutase n=1 Tax=Oligella urethralis TaxID=90245 RepID=A0A2X1ULC6_9BURK|nr:phosphoglucosamine mutase [Oligella urethralis]AVL70546.1 phosphoglucosamine mutase [Oligella urethralis]SPY07976.1 Phosphoglucosamine mutase [Oligella urethralis]SUA59265.1 Phosphoglucosamine mutase [Oligella urethralis]SUA61891.1 Phosphoglucosamine mutase [Oligella urethralis]
MARKYFGTDGVRGRVGGAVINAEFALKLAYAAGRVLASQGLEEGDRPTVLIGKDTRVSGYMLEAAMQAGFAAAGVDVLLAGPIPTPAVAYLTRTLRLNAGVVISASHNPYHDNGIKFFSENGLKLPDEIELKIEALIDEDIKYEESESIGRARRLNDATGRYIEFCKSSFPNDLNLRGLKIVVDAAHGAAYHVAPYVFKELGATVIPIGCSPDGFNINRNVGALYPEQLVATVNAQRADYGIALDGDADRIQMVDSRGNIYNGDELLYAIILERRQRMEIKGVAGTLMTNFGLEKRLKDLGIPLERAKVGDRYVLEALHQNGWYFGGESSGHLLCLDCHTTGDGIIAALQVLTAVVRSGKTLRELTHDLKMYPQVMINVPLKPGLDWQNHAELQRVRAEVEAELGDRGRVLIRASGTEPILRLMVEAETHELAKRGVERLADVSLDA